MKNTLSFKREYTSHLPLILVPSKRGYRARTNITKCSDGKCKKEYLPHRVKKIKITSKKGISIDIQNPHELRFSFEGDIKCKDKGKHLLCSGEIPTKSEFDAKGEFVSSFSGKNIELNNIPIRHTWQNLVYAGIGITIPLVSFIHPLLTPWGLSLYLQHWPFGIVTPIAGFFTAQSENRNNHWFLNGMRDDVHEINIISDDVKSVEIDLNHPTLSTANIKLNREVNCEVLAEPKWVTERRKLFCL